MSRHSKLGCHGYRQLHTVHRRSFLQLGALGSFGLSLPGILYHESQAASSATPRAKNIILFWLQGGVSHHDTLDPKPAAPAEVRGEFSTIETTLPGIRFSDRLPRLARLTDKLAVIRSVTHSEASHQRGSVYMCEGRRPPPQYTGTGHSGNPLLGSIIAHELGSRGGMPPFVRLPGNDWTARWCGIGHGWLPVSSGPFRVDNLDLLKLESQSPQQFMDRVRLLQRLEAKQNSEHYARDEFDQFDEQAIDILSSGRAAEAFNIDGESDETKRLYGIGLKGQYEDDKCRYALTARRLIQAGARFVTIGRHSWDMHANIFPELRNRLPRFDNALSGLIEDLQQRGLLDETLVIYLTEYGRTPNVNNKAGRDHWPQAFSIALAGAGIRAGQVIGASDKNGAAVVDRPVTPEEIAATILRLAGVDPQKEFIQRDGRPIRYVDRAKPIGELL